MEGDSVTPSGAELFGVFQRLEDRTRQLSQAYRQVLQRQNKLFQENEEKDRIIAELEARLQNQEEIFTQVDQRIERLLQQLDECLPSEGESEPFPSEQVLPGMNGG
jgi:heme oxygenase